jgi:DnaJ-class molecular chaperone
MSVISAANLLSDQFFKESTSPVHIGQNAAMWGSPVSVIGAMTVDRSTHQALEFLMANEKGPNIKKKQKCKNCEGKGLLKKGDKVVKCQRCGGTGVR